MSDEEWVDFGATQDDSEWYARAQHNFGLDVRPRPDPEGSNSCTTPISQLFEIPIVAFRMSWPNVRRSLPIRFGMVAPTTPDLIIHCETAEALGFEAA